MNCKRLDTNISYLPIHEIDFHRIMVGMIKATATTPKIAKFRINHIDRVKTLAMQLMVQEPNVEPEKVEIMVLIHDMYKYTESFEHGKAAAMSLKEQFIKPYLKRSEAWMTKKRYIREKEEWSKVYEALILHSEKAISPEKCKKNPYLRIILDADILDKLTVGYIEGFWELFFEPSTDEPDNILPVIKKYVERVCEGYIGKCNSFTAVRNQLVELLILHSQPLIASDPISMKYYREKIYPIVPRKLKMTKELP